MGGEGTNRPDRFRLVDVVLDEASIGRNTPDVEHERKIAVFDLLEENAFALADGREGPYVLRIAIEESRLVLAVADAGHVPMTTFMLSLSPFRRVVKDYFMVCDSYYEAIRTAPPSRIEALDMGRRALHDEGSKLLQERLSNKIEIDFDTARRLFTLICALHWKG
jgi:uncharacterized protein (UPF0262 family)